MAGQRRLGLFGKLTGPRLLDPQSALEQARSTVYAWDLTTDAIAWGPNAATVLGVPHIGLLGDGTALSGAVEPEGHGGRADMIRAEDGPDGGQGVPYRARYALRVKSDRLVMVEETGRWFADAAGRPALARGALKVEGGPLGAEDLTAGLKARAALLAGIVDDVVEAQRSRHAMTLVVGGFEPNAADAGEVMDQVARRVRPLMRRRDRFVAYAANRFALVLASCPASEAPGAVRRLLGLIDGPEAEPLLPDLRLGAASAPDHALDAPELLRRAEEALASAVGRFAIFDAGACRTSADRGGTGLADIVDALNGRSLVAAFEPVLDARTGASAFSLLRPCLEDGPAGPRIVGDLETAAENTGLHTLTDARLAELAVERLAAHPGERIALPISGATLRDGEWLTVLAAHLGARPGVESRLIVDVPEAALGVPAIRGRLDAMKALGVGLMIRGFGTGHVGLKHLRSLPVDLVRIEGALVQTLARSPEDRLVVRSLVDLAHHVGIAAVAEGVEDEAAARLLAGFGMDYIQGPSCGAPARPAQDDERRRAGAA
ncbi:MAG TPA: GGDEF domain-containing phosphodiesterase [Microvirga sp.]|jgi:EAL domain-containing protein (putative c-di-GMP-specific phosphodiesterase class I)